MQTDTLTLYKLIILFILDKVDFPLTNNQVTGFILEKEYTNYFNIQQAINELSDASLIFVETIRNASLFHISDSGRETIHFFRKDISEGIQSDILEYLKAKKYDLREELSALADYYEEKKGEYIARCYVQEQGSKIVEVLLNVPTEEEAENICKHWKEKSQEIYAYLMRTLM